MTYVHVCAAAASVASARQQFDAEISSHCKSVAFSLEVACTASSNFLHVVKLIINELFKFRVCD